MTAQFLTACCLLLAQVPAEPEPAESPAVEAPADDLQEQVRLLAKQLDARELADREQAEQQLLELGPAVLDLLPKPTARTSAEVKERLGRIRDKLQHIEAESFSLPTRVTLQADARPLSEVMAAITEQTGNRLVDYREQFNQPARDPEVSVAFDGTPFWQALDELLDQSNSTLYGYADEEAGALALIDRPPQEAPRLSRPFSYAGPFRLEVLRVDASTELRNPEARTLRLELEASWEPRLNPISLTQQLGDLTAVDEQGNSLPLGGDASQAIDVQIVPETRSTEFRIPLALPPRSTQRIASLKGRIQALLPGRVETFRFSDLKTANQEQSRAGAVVTLERVRRNGEVWDVRVRLRFEETSGALQSHMNWVLNNQAFLEDKEGNVIPHDGYETTRRTDDEVGVSYKFGLEGGIAGHVFVYQTPVIIVALPLEYEIKDLPLP